MPIPEILRRLADAFVQRERMKLGIPAEERAAAEAADTSLLRRAQAARAMQQLRFDDESHPVDMDYRRALAQQARAHASQYMTPKPGKTVERTVDLGDRIRTYFSDGTVSEEPKGAAPRRAGSGGASRDGAAANPFNMTDGQGNIRAVVRGKDGNLHFVDKVDGVDVGPGPTADQRNIEYQAQAVEPAFELVQNSLDNLKRESAGFTGSVAGMVPGTKSYFAKTHFQEQAKALLGAIVARQAGEGSRLSDDDRRAYSRAATLVDNTLLLPNGIEEAQKRLTEARALINMVVQRRRGGGAPGAHPAVPPAPGADVDALLRKHGIQ